MVIFRRISPVMNLSGPIQEEGELAGNGRFGKDKIFWAHLELNRNF